MVYCYDKSSGLRAIIAIHDTTLGPALGGCRFWHYENEADALRDALRLSRGMTYKAAVPVLISAVARRLSWRTLKLLKRSYV